MARLAAIAMGSLLLACSSTTNNGSSCGPGTVLQEGTCVIPDAGPGDTATAIDDARDTGDTGVDIEDSSRPDTTLIDVGVDIGPDVGEDSLSPDTPSSTGDPCPSKVIDINCSATCGTSSTSCSEVRCSARSDLYAIKSYSQLPFIMRTPDKPGVDGACSALPCETGTSVAYGMAFTVILPTYKNGIRVSVGAPWHIRRALYTYPYCTVDIEFPGQCAYVDTTVFYFLVYTNDPNAPSRNILIEDPSEKKCL